MKKLLSSLLVAVLCFSAVAAVAADDFVPSISYKEAPEVVPYENGDYGIMMLSDDWEVLDGISEECLEITPISEVDESDVIPEEEKKEILDVYASLTDGSMKIPYEGEFADQEMVIRDLFDARLVCDDEHAEKLLEKGVVLELTFDLGIAADEKIAVMVYVDGEWVPAVRVINNGDGTVSIAFEELGLVAISVPAEVESAQTGDNASVGMWVVIMLAAVAALLIIFIAKNKRRASK